MKSVIKRAKELHAMRMAPESLQSCLQHAEYDGKREEAEALKLALSWTLPKYPSPNTGEPDPAKLAEFNAWMAQR